MLCSRSSSELAVARTSVTRLCAELTTACFRELLIGGVARSLQALKNAPSEVPRWSLLTEPKIASISRRLESIWS